MLDKKFSCLPVIGEMDTIEGIVTKTDLLESVYRK
jgi:CBS domain-containing protein